MAGIIGSWILWKEGKKRQDQERASISAATSISGTNTMAANPEKPSTQASGFKNFINKDGVAVLIIGAIAVVMGGILLYTLITK